MQITLRLTRPAWAALRKGSRRVHEAKLTEQSEVIQPAPALHDATVPDPEDLNPAERDRPTGGRHSHDLALLRAVRGELLHDQVTLTDKVIDVAVPVGEGGTEHGAGPAYALAVRGRPE